MTEWLVILSDRRAVLGRRTLPPAIGCCNLDKQTTP
jgi:hypothetical protein